MLGVETVGTVGDDGRPRRPACRPFDPIIRKGWAITCEDAPAIPQLGSPNWPGHCPYGS